MTAASYLSHAIVKPVVAGAVAGAIDHFVMKNPDVNSCAMFAGAVAGGVFAVSWVEPLVSPLFPTHTPIGNIGKALEGRIVEIACGSASAYAVNHLVLKNEYTTNDLLYKLAIIVAGDIAGETICELCLIV